MTEREVLERLIQGVPLVRGAGGVDPWPLQVQAGLARKLPEDFPPPPTRRTFRADPWTPTSGTWLGRILTTPWLCEIVGVLGTPGKAADRADRIVDLVSRLSREGGLGGHHAPHQVAGHLRQIPLAWRASETSRRDAEASGVRLPEGGFTWVRPHSRGTGIEGEVPEVKRVRVSKRARRREEDGL